MTGAEEQIGKQLSPDNRHYDVHRLAGLHYLGFCFHVLIYYSLGPLPQSKGKEREDEV